MSDERVDHETIERVIEQDALNVLHRLPMSNKKEQAREHIREAARLAHDVVETGGC